MNRGNPLFCKNLFKHLNRKLNETCRDIASTFLSRFQLTEEESNALKSSDLVPAFFKALVRVQQIHSDCKVLLRTQHQRAG